MRNNKEIKLILKKLKNFIVKNYGNKVKKVILYGSYAKGNPKEDSDIDIMVVVDNSVNSYKIEEELNEILFDILIEYRKLVSLLVVNEGLFQNYKSPLFSNIKEEGIVV